MSVVRSLLCYVAMCLACARSVLSHDADAATGRRVVWLIRHGEGKHNVADCFSCAEVGRAEARVTQHRRGPRGAHERFTPPVVVARRGRARTVMRVGEINAQRRARAFTRD